MADANPEPDIPSNDEWGDNNLDFANLNLFFDASSITDQENMTDDSDIEENDTKNGDGIGRWVRQPSRIDKMPEPEPFNEVEMGLDKSISARLISNFFRVFFALEILNSIINATNEYAARVRRADPEHHKGKWFNVYTTQIAHFFGLTFLMGMIIKPQLKDYWLTLQQIATPYFSQVMRRDTFI